MGSGSGAGMMGSFYPSTHPSALRPLAEIRRDILELERETEGLLGKIIR